MFEHFHLGRYFFYPDKFVSCSTRSKPAFIGKDSLYSLSAFRLIDARENKIPIYFEPTINHSSSSLWREVWMDGHLGDNMSKSTLNKLMQQHSVENVLFMTFFRRANVFIDLFMLTHLVLVTSLGCLWSVLDIFFVFSSFLIVLHYANFRSTSRRSHIDWINYPSVLQ